MEVKPGYKQTEVGVIPEEWDVLPLGKVTSIERGKFSARPRNDPRYYGGDFPFIQTGDVTRSGGLITSFTQTLNNDGLRVSRLFPKGTLFFTIAANIGDVGIAMFEAACPDSLVAIVPGTSVEKRWLLYELARRKEDFEKLASPGAQLNINLEKLRPYLIPVPATHEQRAIATALSDVDALLGSLDRLIAKKRDLKQAAMQQLLTGQTRLPGFHGEWGVKTLGELATVTKGSQLHSSKTDDEGQFPHLNGGISASSYTDKANTPANTIAISEGGNSCGYVQFMSLPFWCGGHCYAVVPKNVNNHFLYHALKGQQSAIMGLRVGSGLPNVQKTALTIFKLNLPSDLPEQSAIAAVLSDMDAELALQEQRLAKTRALKQGMMQELLTGKTRLI